MFVATQPRTDQESNPRPLGGAVGWTSVKRSRVRLLVGTRLCSDSRQVVHSLVFLSSSSKFGVGGQLAVVVCGWEDNSGSGITVAV